MKVFEIFQENNKDHCISIISFDRDLSMKERNCHTALVKDLVLNVRYTTNERWMYTTDTINNPESFAGEEIILL